ncbi:hypothetical protein [Pedobacter jejuensis]|uniref:Uncharacterized protein n=1 Tax=Pedobacter jejuensis TaxID=1268550 RepID=A0A3N0C0X5_9SPHI|nr:hypothetical protein [Pedobacter jejuensis]RNL55847.1 hypothetical protein D7004_03595 [Pedobacter jejuensis]
MSSLLTYRFPLLTAVTWIFFLVLMTIKLADLKIISFKSTDVQINKKSSGTYGKFSFKLTVSTNKQEVFTRSYKTLALSNGFIDLEKLQKANSIWMVVSENKSKSNEFQLYSIADHKPGRLRIFFEMISYLINNYLLIICLPLILTLLICTKEFGRDYQYINQPHQKIISASYFFNALFIALIAIY